MKNSFELDCLLINPPDFPSRYPYLGLCYLAAVLRENQISVKIIDSSALQLSIEEVISIILEVKPKIIGITIMSPTLPSSYTLINMIKTEYPHGIIVVGGAHINANPEFIRDLKVKYGFHGECEYQFSIFCKKILSDTIPDNIEGLIINFGDQLIIGKKPIVENLDLLPFPAYDLLPIEKYYSPNSNNKVISYISSRGCPYDCIFCSKLQKTKYRFLSSIKVVEHIETLIKDYNIEWIEFVDEIFTLNRDRTVELCQIILNKKIIFRWGCATRADRIDEDLILLMKAAGCKKIGFGVETGVERVRWTIKKYIRNEQIEKAIKLCQKNGIKTQACFILGHPTESITEMKSTIKFAQKIGANYTFFFRMIPMPGSELFDRLLKNNEIEPNIWKDYMEGKISLPIYSPNGIEPKKINSLVKYAWIFVYFWPKNIWNNRDLFFKSKTLLQGINIFFDYSFRRYQKKTK